MYGLTNGRQFVDSYGYWISWGRLLVVELRVLRVVMTFCALYRNRRFSTRGFTSTCDWSLLWARWICFVSSSVKDVSLLSSLIRWYLQCFIFSSVCGYTPSNTEVNKNSRVRACPVHLIILDFFALIILYEWMKIMEIITVQVFASTCCFLSIPNVLFSTLSVCYLLDISSWHKGSVLSRSKQSPNVIWPKCRRGSCYQFWSICQSIVRPVKCRYI